MGENVCPVCGCGSLVEPAFNERGVGSDDICPCCGFQFGLSDFPYEDRERLIAEWRERWVAGGCVWKFPSDGLPPEGWDPQAQLARTGGVTVPPFRPILGARRSDQPTPGRAHDDAGL